MYLNTNQNHLGMKKAIIGALVGGLIIFLWQFVSYPLAGFHDKAMQYTDKQDALLSAIKSQNLEDGGYMLPSLPRTASSEEHKELMTKMEGQPWVSIQYHNSYNMNMGMNMVRAYLVQCIAVFLLCLILLRIPNLSFGSVVSASLFTGLIVFLNGSYTGHIWFQTFDSTMHLVDAIVSWGLVGAWLGWWLRRGQNNLSTISVNERAKAVAD